MKPPLSTLSYIRIGEASPCIYWPGWAEVWILLVWTNRGNTMNAFEGKKIKSPEVCRDIPIYSNVTSLSSLWQQAFLPSGVVIWSSYKHVCLPTCIEGNPNSSSFINITYCKCPAGCSQRHSVMILSSPGGVYMRECCVNVSAPTLVRRCFCGSMELSHINDIRMFRLHSISLPSPQPFLFRFQCYFWEDAV